MTMIQPTSATTPLKSLYFADLHANAYENLKPVCETKAHTVREGVFDVLVGKVND
jgi:hypothetical protein